MRKKIAYSILGGAIIFICFLLISNNRHSDTFSKKNLVEILRKEKKEEIDSVLNAIGNENRFYSRILFLIESNDTASAKKIIDSVLKNPNSGQKIYLYKGILLEKSSRFDEAIDAFNESMKYQEYPVALYWRAQAYFALKKNKEAINDCLKASYINPDYYMNLSEMFRKLNMIDSADKYFQIYLQHQ